MKFLLVPATQKKLKSSYTSFFIRVHNSFILNSRQIIKIEDNHVYIKDKRIPIGEKFRRKVYGSHTETDAFDSNERLPIH